MALQPMLWARQPKKYLEANTVPTDDLKETSRLAGGFLQVKRPGYARAFCRFKFRLVPRHQAAAEGA